MDVTIRLITKDKMKKDKLMEKYPCFIMIKGLHNHSRQSAEALSQLRVLPKTRETFIKYFEQGKYMCKNH